MLWGGGGFLGGWGCCWFLRWGVDGEYPPIYLRAIVVNRIRVHVCEHTSYHVYLAFVCKNEKYLEKQRECNHSFSFRFLKIFQTQQQKVAQRASMQYTKWVKVKKPVEYKIAWHSLLQGCFHWLLFLTVNELHMQLPNLASFFCLVTLVWEGWGKTSLNSP